MLISDSLILTLLNRSLILQNHTAAEPSTSSSRKWRKKYIATYRNQYKKCCDKELWLFNLLEGAIPVITISSSFPWCSSLGFYMYFFSGRALAAADYIVFSLTHSALPTKIELEELNYVADTKLQQPERKERWTGRYQPRGIIAKTLTSISLSSGLKLAAAAASKFFQSPLQFAVVVRQPANGEILAHKPITQSKFETFCLADLSERYENINNFINYIKNTPSCLHRLFFFMVNCFLV